MKFQEDKDQTNKYISTVLGISVSISIKIFATIYDNVLQVTNVNENYQFWEDFYDGLAIKVFSFS